MGNKYGSNIRTYTARNLVWDVSAPQPVPFVMNAPTPITVPIASMLKSFYKAQFIKGVDENVDWNRESKVSIKRAGLFCNFADGLVQKMDTSRIAMTVTLSIFEEYKVNSLGVQFVAGSNEVNGADLTYFAPGDVIYDTLNGIPYYVQVAAENPGDPLYLTDYARATANLTDVYLLPPVDVDETYYLEKKFTISNIATLNTMYDSEIFFPYCPLLPVHRMFLSCFLAIDGADPSLDFYTKSINTDFNGAPVSFDSVIELEITPSPFTTPV